MPTSSIFSSFYIGNLANIDPTEGNTLAENASALVGMTFGSEGDALANYVETLRDWDVGLPDYSYYKQDLNVNDDTFKNLTTDTVQTFDAVAAYNATITYIDGTTATYTATIFQDDMGETYIVPPASAGADLDALEAKAIRSITFDSVAGDDYSGGTKVRQDVQFLACFVAGTEIATAQGPRRVETLQEGALIQTADRGLQPLRQKLTTRVAAQGKNAPVRFGVGSLGPGVPSRALLVSPQHRMIMQSKIAAREIGSAEALVAALHLVGFPKVQRVAGGDETSAEQSGVVTYVHLLFDHHEVIYANGAPTESLYLGHMVQRYICPPQVSAGASDDVVQSIAHHPARPILAGAKRKRVLQRHQTNNQPILQSNARALGQCG